MALSRIQSISTVLLLTAALGVGLATTKVAAQNQSAPPELTPDTSDTLNTDFRPAYDAKNWTKSLEVLQQILPKVKADSYDAAYVCRAEATLYVQELNNPTLALEYLGRALAIDDRKHYFDQKEVQAILYETSLVSYTEANATKDPSAKPQFYAKALHTLERWLEHADLSTLSQDKFQYIATVYFTFGQGGSELGPGQKEDKAMLEKAVVWIDRGMQTVIRPNDTLLQLYALKVAALYQLGRLNEMADCLEFELKYKPGNKNNWQELAQIYQQLANSADEKKDTEASFAYNVHEILTYQRAQQLGFMTTPKDNFNVVAFYSAINQYSRACELLERGLRDNTIESKPENWEILGGWYQQINRNDLAVKTFLTATELFPTNAELEYQLALVYSGVPDEAKAFEHIQACIAKGGTAKPHVGWLFYSYTALNLQKFDEALKAAHEAAAAASKIGATDAVKQAEKMIASIKGNLQDIANRKLQLK
jgi:hypothetical protein